MRVVVRLVCAAVRWGGLSWLVRNTVARRRASILVYHDPAPELLERHLRYLTARYSLIPLSRLVDAMRAGAWAELPPRPLVLTFDDGHRGNTRLARVLERHGVSATIYLCSQIVDTPRHFWFLDVADPEPLKVLPDGERRAVTAERDGERQALTAAELRRLTSVAEFASHTRSHPVLTMCDDDECRAEIALSRRELEELLGAPCRHFSFPNGDYGPRELRLVREAGYASARTVDLGWNTARTDPFRLKILGTNDDASVSRLAADLAGVAGYLARVRVGRFDGRHRQLATRPRAMPAP
jgi:peptidoglycan/xylan/chitin deacetylase (PgdA/CDA1 family)